MDKWVEKKSNWLNGHVPKKKRVKASVDDKSHNINGVVFYPIRCPACDSKNVKCYSTRPKLRYYSCRQCKHKFKAVEAE